jgi:hypothetical protein
MHACTHIQDDDEDESSFSTDIFSAKEGRNTGGPNGHPCDGRNSHMSVNNRKRARVPGEDSSSDRDTDGHVDKMRRSAHCEESTSGPDVWRTPGA